MAVSKVGGLRLSYWWPNCFNLLYERWTSPVRGIKQVEKDIKVKA